MYNIHAYPFLQYTDDVMPRNVDKNGRLVEEDSENTIKKEYNKEEETLSFCEKVNLSLTFWKYFMLFKN